MTTVFNTGKVRIGAAYVRPVRQESDPDMLRLQRALMGDESQHTDRDGIAIVVACALAAVWVLFGFWF